jgi:hypothetical protein
MHSVFYGKSGVTLFDKVDTYNVTYSVCVSDFSIRVLSNLELLQKRSISHTQKNKNTKLLASKVEF